MTREAQLALYAAEDAALAGSGIVFRGPAEAQRYADSLLAGDWWSERWPRVERVVVRPSRSRRWSGYASVEGDVPEIRLSALTEPVLLHELAHIAAPEAGHGPAFVAVLLALVRHRMGFHAYGALRHALTNVPP